MWINCTLCCILTSKQKKIRDFPPTLKPKEENIKVFRALKSNCYFSINLKSILKYIHNQLGCEPLKLNGFVQNVFQWNVTYMTFFCHIWEQPLVHLEIHMWYMYQNQLARHFVHCNSYHYDFFSFLWHNLDCAIATWYFQRLKTLSFVLLQKC